MSVKQHGNTSGNVHASWLKKREESASKDNENKKVAKYFDRQKQMSGHGGIGNITARLKETKFKMKSEIKAKLVDDAHVTKYVVTAIDKHVGIVTLKNDHGTVRKVSVFDKIFDTK